MGHPQPITEINTDNSTTIGFTNKNMQLKKSKSWDMSLHWLRDREKQKQFKVQWKKGADIPADYFTKHHTVTHHRNMRGKFVRDSINILVNNLSFIYCKTNMGLQGCVNPTHDLKYPVTQGVTVTKYLA